MHLAIVDVDFVKYESFEIVDHRRHVSSATGVFIFSFVTKDRRFVGWSFRFYVLLTPCFIYTKIFKKKQFFLPQTVFFFLKVYIRLNL